MHPKPFAVCCIVAMAAIPAMGAPFCVAVTGISPQCLYFDARECATEARRLGGVCQANPDELTFIPGEGRFCSVDSSRAATCVFSDRASCDADAARKNGVCIDNIKLGKQPNEFDTDPEKRY